MKTSHKISILSVLLIGIIFLVSCSKSEMNSKLLGKWKYINVANIYDTINDTKYIEDWEFLSSGDLNIYYRDISWGGDSDSLQTYTAKYKMDTYYKFSISECTNGHLPQYNTQWEIVSQKDNTLMIVNDGDGTGDGSGLYFREFVKEKE